MKLTRLCAVLGLCLAGSLPAGASARMIAAVPGSWFPIGGYATPAAATTVDGPLQFLNTDIQLHDVVSTLKTTDPATWDPRYCILPVGWKPGDPLPPCELFRSPIAGLGDQPVDVLITMPDGSPKLEGGTIYEFYCEPHPYMRGRLVVAPE